MDVQGLIEQWRIKKTVEDELKAERQAIAKQIAEALEHPEEGSKTHAVGPYKVTVKGTINRRVDWGALDGVFERHPECHAPVRVKRELDDKGVRWIRDNAPEIYAEMAETITAKPEAPGIKVEVVGDA